MVPVTIRVPLLDPVSEFRHNGVVKFRSEGDVATAQVVAPSDGHTRQAIVQLLLEEGPITAGGRAKLDHTYDDLAVAAMRQLREIGGDAAVRTFARRRIDTILAGVTDGPHDIESTADRVAGALTEAGYATTTTPVTGPIHGIQLCQHHCPVSHVAEEFPELCETEREAFAEILGTHVQRLATIVNGDCACTTHVPLTETSTDTPTTLRRTARAEAATTKQGAS